jgi:hypothetical protein
MGSSLHALAENRSEIQKKIKKPARKNCRLSKVSLGHKGLGRAALSLCHNPSLRSDEPMSGAPYFR